ncbi:MAG: PadR family transcriptional regulator [Gemmatimonadota bacterium]|nr:PadR family transcriptional regulator [Gemmatimonadota bacterium]
MVQSSEVQENLSLEIRRGAIVLAVLGALVEEAYGYALRKSLSERGLDVEEGTLYPLLRRLESQGLLRSRWRVENGRRRRYYRTTDDGDAVRAELTVDWDDLTRAMEAILS